MSDQEGTNPAPRSDAESPIRQETFARRVVIAVAIVIGMFGVAMFLRKSVSVLLLAFAAILIAVMLRGLALWLAPKLRLPIWGALLLVIFSLVGFFALLGFLIAPSVAAQFEELADQLPKSVDAAQEKLRHYTWGRKLLGESEAGHTAAGPTTQPRAGGSAISQAIDATTKPATIGKFVNYSWVLMETLFTTVLVLIVGLYLAVQPRLYVEGTLKLFPKSERNRLREVMYEIGRTLHAWMLGQLIPMAAIGIFVGGGLKLIGVPLWLPLGILAALLNFVPNFGPIIAAVPAILIAAAADPPKALWVILLSVAAQNLEGYVITPLVQRKAVQMPPALTILSQVLMSLLLGPLGLVLAAPLTASAIVAIKMLYVEDALGTPVEKDGAA